MGLDTSHDCWHGSYSAFNTFRTAIARAAGIDYEDMEGVGGTTAWRTLKPDPIHILLTHSDCEGSISWKEAATLAKRLDALILKLPHRGQNDGWIADAARKFASGCRRAAAKHEDIEFA